MFRPLPRKINLIVHALFSVGLLGSILAFTAMAATALLVVSESARSGLYPAMSLVTLAAIVPMALAANLSGIISALATPWGLFSHRWIVYKFWITLFATVVLLIKTRLVMRMADCYSGGTCLIDDRWHSGLELVVHAVGGFTILLVPLALSMLKPKGLTAYGQRKVN